MLDYLRALFDTRTLSPHGICLFWRPELLWTHVVSDAVIFLAYMTIPAALLVIARKRRDIPFGWMVGCFALFILACGVTHAMGIWTLWRPDYGVEALVKAATAVASIGTAIALWSLIPLAVSLPSPSQLRAANEELRRRIEERDAAIMELRQEQEQRQRAEEALTHAQKLEALGQLTGGIAHDFNNLLQAVQASFELIQRRAAEPAAVARIAQSGLKAAERGADLTGKLLAFARTKQLRRDVFDVADVVSEMRELLSRSIGPAIDLRFNLQSEEIPVVGDRGQLELAIVNLVINGRDAIEGADGRIVISTAAYEAGPDDEGLSPGEYVRLSVSDNGSGMSPDVARKAFEPFFTTKPVGAGTGLGLSQVYGLARQLGGAARIETEPGKGTVVSVFVPRAAGAQLAREGPTPAGRSPVLPEARVLLVDDDDFVRNAAAEVLQGLGVVVTEKSSGETALAKVKSAPDVAILDYAMPGMNGVELARRLRERWPAMPVIFVTGFADAEELQTALGANETILRKPYRAADLHAALAGVLSAGRA